MKRWCEVGITTQSILLGFLLIFGNDIVEAAPAKVIGFGDSITTGWPYITSDQNGSTVGGYEPTLNALLNGAGWDVTVLNYGHLGELSVQGDNRIQSVLERQNPDWVLILEGTNDLFWISTDSVMSNLASMANKVRAGGRNVVLATLTPDTRGGKPISQINDRIRAWASAHEVPLADQYAAVAPDWNNVYTTDKLHPNTAGYQVMAKTWFETILASSRSVNTAPIILLLLDN
ncbi:MAG: SGNH/GDSL hydrolase family protein [Desulforhopalus sp.]